MFNVCYYSLYIYHLSPLIRYKYNRHYFHIGKCSGDIVQNVSNNLRVSARVLRSYFSKLLSKTVKDKTLKFQSKILLYEQTSGVVASRSATLSAQTFYIKND